MGRRVSAVLVVLGVATGCGSGGALGQSTAPEVQGSPPTTVADLTGTTVEPSGQSTNADPGTTSVVVTGIAPTEVATTATTAVGAPQAQLYETMTVVLESPQHGPSLCVGGMLDSMPPQCGDIPLVGWDWGMVDSEQTVNGTTWFDYQDQVVVTGTYDGATFTLASVRKPTAAELEAERPVMDLEAPCPEPAGGWLAQAARHPPLVHGSADLFPGVPQYLATQPSWH